MSQSHCSPVVAISDRQSNRLQNRFDLIQIICYMKFMFVNICKIGLLVLVVQTKQMANTVRRYSLYTTFITSKYFNKATPFIKRASDERPYGLFCSFNIKLSTRTGNGGSPCNSKLLVKNHALHYNIRKM